MVILIREVKSLVNALLVLSILLFSCKASKESAKSEPSPASDEEQALEAVHETQEGPKGLTENLVEPQALPQNLEVSGCEVIATVVSIDEWRDTSNPDAPCGKFPCGALIRIDKVVKMGQQCAPYVISGAEMKAFFKFTLANTEIHFPDMKQHFPGLEKSDTFAATFTTTAEPGEGYQVVIYTYTKTE